MTTDVDSLWLLFGLGHWFRIKLNYYKNRFMSRTWMIEILLYLQMLHVHPQLYKYIYICNHISGVLIIDHDHHFRCMGGSDRVMGSGLISRVGLGLPTVPTLRPVGRRHGTSSDWTPPAPVWWFRCGSRAMWRPWGDSWLCPKSETWVAYNYIWCKIKKKILIKERNFGELDFDCSMTWL